MKRTIETINFDADAALINHVEELFDELPKFHDGIHSADVYLKRHEQKVENEYEVQVKVFLPGHEVFSDAEGESINDAAKRVIAKTKRQLRELNDADKSRHQPRPDKQY